jgi:hypothetical protein
MAVMTRRALSLVAALVVLAGCGSSGSKATPTTTTTRARPPASRTTTTTATAPASSTTSTTSGCAPVGSIAAVNVAFPDRKSGLVGKAVRTGAHPCYERFVVELQSSATNDQFPGYFVRYVPKPISLAPSDQPITIRGDAVLMVSLGSWMNGPEGGYAGPKDVLTTGLTAIREYRLVEDFEGQSAWALGLDRTRAFEVTTLTGPPRLVVDVSVP